MFLVDFLFFFIELLLLVFLNWICMFLLNIGFFCVLNFCMFCVIRFWFFFFFFVVIIIIVFVEELLWLFVEFKIFNRLNFFYIFLVDFGVMWFRGGFNILLIGLFLFFFVYIWLCFVIFVFVRGCGNCFLLLDLLWIILFGGDNVFFLVG